MMQKNKMVLFVCTGNTCRSPFAAAVWNRLARERGMSVHAESCGLAAVSGEESSPAAIEAAQNLGYDIKEHRARGASAYLLEEAEHIYVMSPSHLRAIENANAEWGKKTSLLSPDGVPDPYGGNAEVYRNAYEAIEEAVRKRMDHREAGEA
ncbi:arsenate reductase/protein-tyrosine-phosphatase family protein [Acidaminobacterium chupaoyuni]